MLIPPATPAQKARAERLQCMINEAEAAFKLLTPEEQRKHLDAQRDSWVRGEMSWPRDCPYR